MTEIVCFADGMIVPGAVVLAGHLELRCMRRTRDRTDAESHGRIIPGNGANHLHRRRHEDDVVELHAVGRRRQPLRRALRRGVKCLERVEAPQAVADDRQMLRGLPYSGLFSVEHDLLKLPKQRGSNGVSRTQQQNRPDDVARKIGDDVPQSRRIELATGMSRRATRRRAARFPFPRTSC